MFVLFIAGDGLRYPTAGSIVTIHYIGKFTDGSIFESTRKRRTPKTIHMGVDPMIKGWEEALPTMSKGETAMLFVSAAYGYGATGFPPLIPPREDLIFEIEVVDIEESR
ncbi:putative FKBP-type peptidyl-prolyl isomerase [Chytridium lagenaria]|nr:putative FKBP-type peptidyl-prolyl isomerase [Chytridium lagenaria]